MNDANDLATIATDSYEHHRPVTFVAVPRHNDDEKVIAPVLGVLRDLAERRALPRTASAFAVCQIVQFTTCADSLTEALERELCFALRADLIAAGYAAAFVVGRPSPRSKHRSAWIEAGPCQLEPFAWYGQIRVSRALATTQSLLIRSIDAPPIPLPALTAKHATAEYIRRLRGAAGLTRTQLGALASVGANSVSEIERGERYGLRTLTRILWALNVENAEAVAARLAPPAAPKPRRRRRKKRATHKKPKRQRIPGGLRGARIRREQYEAAARNQARTDNQTGGKRE